MGTLALGANLTVNSHQVIPSQELFLQTSSKIVFLGNAHYCATKSGGLVSPGEQQNVVDIKRRPVNSVADLVVSYSNSKAATLQYGALSI